MLKGSQESYSFHSFVIIGFCNFYIGHWKYLDLFRFFWYLIDRLVFLNNSIILFLYLIVEISGIFGFQFGLKGQDMISGRLIILYIEFISIFLYSIIS
jgi:hypothetical protein